MSGDDVLPLSDAAEVWSVEGSSYLDRTIADVAAAAVEVRTGDVLGADHRLVRTAHLVNEVGDQVATSLVAHVRATLLPPADGGPLSEGDLRAGWHEVVMGLAGSPTHRAN